MAASNMSTASRREDDERIERGGVRTSSKWANGGEPRLKWAGQDERMAEDRHREQMQTERKAGGEEGDRD